MYSVNLLAEGPLPFESVFERQLDVHARVSAGEAPDTVLLLEHEPVYTLGSGTRRRHIPQTETLTVRTTRGGSVTYHGPGQLVVYPILRVKPPKDVRAYVHALEGAVIETLGDEFGIETERVEGRPGVWVRRDGEPDRKICALGVRIARDTTMHGIALNVHPDMRYFERIVPCGLEDARAVSLRELGVETTVETVAEALLPRLERRLRPQRREEQIAKDRVAPGERPAPEGRRLLRVEAQNARTPVEEKPRWIRARVHLGPEYLGMRDLARGEGLHTVCEEAGCPNIYECWEDREASFLIGGDTCTRRCDFCMIATGKPAASDRDEPRRVAESVRRLGLRYTTVTGVARDDLPDGASWLYAETCRQIRALNPSTGVELLVDDFRGAASAYDRVFEAAPDVFAHNLETVPRIFRQIRPAFRYERSLDALRRASDAGLVTKSNLILGMGETRAEIESTMRDLRDHGCDLLTLTQYLRPSKLHHPIDRWVRPEEFVELREVALGLGFSGVLAGPLVRSSYRAGRLWAEAMRRKGRAIPVALAHLEAEGPARQDARTLVAAGAE